MGSTEESYLILVQSIVASDVFYLITLYLSRCCVVAIYSRLTPRRRHKNTLWGILGFTTAGIVISILVITIDCSLNKPWVTPGEHCTSLVRISPDFNEPR